MIKRIAAIVLFAAFAVGCGGDQKVEQTEAKGGKKYGGVYTSNVLRGDPNGLDPVIINSKHADDIAAQIFDKLIDLNSKLELVPEVAKKLPAISQDGLIYRFDLRTDVNFHDNPCFPDGKGRRLNAYDVKYSLTRCCDPRTRTVAFWAFKDKVKGATEYFEAIRDGAAGMRDSAAGPATDTAADTGNAGTTAGMREIEGFRVIDDSTFQIELVTPYAPFIYYLVNALGNIVPFEAVEMYRENFFQNPVGSGAFIFESWKPGEELLLRRNPNYWESDIQGNRLPLLEKLRFQFAKDDKTQFREFENGTLDEVFGIPTEFFPEVYDIATKKPTDKYSKYEVQSTPAMLTWFIDFNTQREPFKDPNVRRAFSYAVDREKIVTYVLQNSPYAPAVHGIIPPVFGSYPVDSIRGYRFDPVEAKRLMTVAGFPDGKGFPPVTLYIYPEPRLVTVAEAVQGMISSTLNITLDIKQVDFAQFQQQAEMGKYLFWGTRWYGDYPDPETFLNLLYGANVPPSDTLPSYPNGTRYMNARFDALFRKGVSTIDVLARMAHYSAAENIAMGDAPVLPLFYENHFQILQPWVRDRSLDAMARIDLKYTWVERE